MDDFIESVFMLKDVKKFVLDMEKVLIIGGF